MPAARPSNPDKPQQLIEPSHKKGISLACGYDNMDRLESETRKLNVSWLWNWGTQPPIFSGIESIPTIWDMSHIGEPLGGNSQWVIGPNECEQDDQCRTSAWIVAREWPRLVATYPGRKYGSPQVVNPEKRYLEDFVAFYKAQNNGSPPPMDAIIIHTYWGNNIEDYKKQVLYYIELAKKWDIEEVWITEFAFAPVMDGTVRSSARQLAEYITWLDAQPMVKRYAAWTNRVECMENIIPDGIFDTPLYGANGAMTELGRMYAQVGLRIRSSLKR
jgi:hypothetical protein